MESILFQKMVHEPSGQQLDLSMLKEATYIETLRLDGPKLLLSLDDKFGQFRDALGIKEKDKITVTVADAQGGINITEPFTVISSPDRGEKQRYNLMASPVWQIKQLAPKTKVFNQRGIGEICSHYLPGIAQQLASCPVVESYHCIAGSRPSTMLRQFGEEQGVLLWFCRGSMHVGRMAELFRKNPSYEYHYNNSHADYQIITYQRPSQQARLEERNVRAFTGWSEVLGRVKTPPGNPILGKAKGFSRAIAASPNVATLAKGPTAIRTAVDFTCYGNGALAPGMVLKLWWHQGDVERPLDESLPDTVVIEAVAHHYASQKYFCRVKGAVALEPRV